MEAPYTNPEGMKTFFSKAVVPKLYIMANPQLSKD
jgi:hypothetical protein